MKSQSIECNRTEIVIRLGMDAQVCENLGGIDKNDVCTFICVSVKDRRKIPKKIDYSKVADNALKMQNSIVIGRDDALNLLRGSSL